MRFPDEGDFESRFSSLTIAGREFFVELASLWSCFSPRKQSRLLELDSQRHRPRHIGAPGSDQ